MAINFDELDCATKSYDNWLKTELEREKDFIDSAFLAIKLEKSLSIRHDTEEEKRKHTEKLNSFKTSLAKRQASYAQKLQEYQEGETLRKKRLDELPKPVYANANPERPTVFSSKDVKDTIGILNEDNSSTVKQFLLRLHQYGQTKDFTEEDYKTALSVCLEGRLLEEYMQQTSNTYSEIESWFYYVYHRPATLEHYEEVLKNFQRHAREPIDVFLTRYLLTAKSADSLKPSNEQYYTTEVNKILMVELSLIEPVRSAFVRWKNKRHDGGFGKKFEEILHKAKTMELEYNCIPKHDISVSLRGNTAHNSHVIEQYAQPAMRLSDNRPKSKPYTRPGIMNKPQFKASVPKVDSVRATSQKPSFYLARNNAPIPTRLPQNTQVPQLIKSNNPGRVKNQQPAFNVALRKQRINQNRYRNIGVNGAPSQSASSRNTYRPINRAKYLPQPIRQQPNVTVSRRPMNMRPQLKQKHRIVRKGLWCERCGTQKGSDSKTSGTDHTTPTCPYYKNWNEHNCSYCLSTKGLEAKHFARDCLQQPRNKSATIV